MFNGGVWTVDLETLYTRFGSDNPDLVVAYSGSQMYDDLAGFMRDKGLRQEYLDLFNHIAVVMVDGEITFAAGCDRGHPALEYRNTFEIFFQGGEFGAHVDLHEWAYPDGFVNDWDEVMPDGKTLREKEW